MSETSLISHFHVPELMARGVVPSKDKKQWPSPELDVACFWSSDSRTPTESVMVRQHLRVFCVALADDDASNRVTLCATVTVMGGSRATGGTNALAFAFVFFDFFLEAAASVAPAPAAAFAFSSSRSVLACAVSSSSARQFNPARIPASDALATAGGNAEATATSGIALATAVRNAATEEKDFAYVSAYARRRTRNTRNLMRMTQTGAQCAGSRPALTIPCRCSFPSWR